MPATSRAIRCKSVTERRFKSRDDNHPKAHSCVDRLDLQLMCPPGVRLLPIGKSL